jgi:hypothetical protein
MPPLRRIAGFLCRFVLFYGVLIAPWPGWNGVYGRWFRAFNQSFFHSNQHRILSIEAAPQPGSPLDTVITLANRNRVDVRGRVTAKKLGLDSRGVGWVPTALFAALALATPVGWRRRAWALFWGLLLIHGFLVFSVGCYIWNQSVDLGIVALPPLGRWAAAGLEETLVTQLGASFVVPALIWLVVTFRVQDLNRLTGSAGA